MSGEIVVPETPNWLKSLEEKREQRLKARLGHEAGAGAPCLKCGDKCPGLDLHFWRKACKICRCPKEEHDVHDDDIYGWAQFQLLGSKPNKIKTTIVLPGKKDEVELEWAPKGQRETIDKYLKTLPPEALPVKGSQAAKERKQMLQKQLPIHDIDPSLCHDLNEEEVKQMEEYIAHIKKNSVGVGQIVNLSNVIKANLHNISPQEAHIIASRYSKGIPFSEIVKLQSSLAKSLEKLSFTDPKTSKKSILPNMQANRLRGNVTEQSVQNPLVASKFKDITHPWYTDSSPNKGLSQPQYAQGFKSGQLGDSQPKNLASQHPDYSINQKLFEGTNFDPTKTPSQFLGYHTPSYRPGQHIGSQSQGQYQNAKGLPYDKVSSELQDGDIVFGSDVEKSKTFMSDGLGGHKESVSAEGKKVPQSEQYGFENPYFNQPFTGEHPNYLNVSHLNTNLGKVPGYSPSKYDPLIDIQDPRAPRSVKDLIYSTYDPRGGPLPEDSDKNSGKNKNVDPNNVGYDPNVVFNTYKHDPSVIKYENPSLLGKCDPAQPLDGNRTGFGPETLKKTGYGYIDPKTGSYVSGKGTFSPDLDQKSSQNQHVLGYLDPKTGKYLCKNAGTLEDRNYYPKNPGEEHFGPGHQNYDPRYHGQGNFNSGHPNHDHKQENVEPGHPNYDPKYDRQENLGPGFANYDPRNPELKIVPGDTNHGQGNFDPVNPNYDPKNGQANFNTEHANYDPRNHGHFGPGHPSYEPRNADLENVGHGHPNYDPRSPYESGYFDPKSGKYILASGDNPEGHYHDPQNPRAPYEARKNTPNNSGSSDPSIHRYDDMDPSNKGSGNLELNRPQNISGIDNAEFGQYPEHCLGNSNAGLRKPRKPLSQLQPSEINIPEDYLEQHTVNVGSIQDIHPDIKAATTEINPGFDNESVYSDNGSDYSPESIREILNNIKLPDCHYCKKPFEENEYAVTVDRANVLFHAQCFKCAGCNQSLADNIYFYHKDTDNVYCGRDYAKIKGYPRCTACDELIFTKEYCLAENSTFHLKHFCCFQCDTPLAGQDYTLEDEKPYCLPCYETSKAARCSTCQNVIKPDELGCQLNGVHFHPDDHCFRCIVCAVPLMGKKLLLRNEKLYCSHDCFNSVKK